MLVRVGLAIGMLVVGARIGSAQPVPTGPEFRASGNRPVLGIDNEPGIAADPSGNFVVTWMSVTDEAGFDVRARRFDATGAPLGLDFQVNATTEGALPDVATDGAGNFVVVWEGPDGDNSGVFARRYDAIGTPQSGDMLVNTLTAGLQAFPQVARAPTGGFVVVWYDDEGNGSNVRARRYDAAGVPQGPDFQVNTYTTQQQTFPRVDADASGNFVVVWTSHTQDGSDAGVFGQRYDAAGIPQGGEFQVNTYTTSAQVAGSVAMSAAGSFVVGFRSLGGTGYDVFARRYDAAGVPLGSDFQVNVFTTGSQFDPNIAVESGGGFVVTWTSYQDGSSTGVVGRLYDAAGVPLGGEFAVNTYTTDSQIAPDVAGLPGGDFVVVWRTTNQFTSDPGGLEIMGKRFTAACGDGAIQPGEGCDDGGNVSGDGCSAACVVESCWACTGAPSSCAPIGGCADGDGCCFAGCEASTDDDCPAHITGARFGLRESVVPSEFYAFRRRITFVSTDPALDTTLATGIDPATDGASLHVYNPATGDSACFELEPALSATWTTSGRDPQAPNLAYRDSGHVNGACKAVRMVDGRRLKITCSGRTDDVPFTYSLDEPTQGSIAVRFRSGGTEYCTVFGGNVKADVSMRRFVAQSAPAPAVCPVPLAPCP